VISVIPVDLMLITEEIFLLVVNVIMHSLIMDKDVFYVPHLVNIA
jgi:hypothetical protein